MRPASSLLVAVLASRADWLIWSTEHQGWWKPARRGYTPNQTLAGRYTLEEALEICQEANAHLLPDHSPQETMIPLACMPRPWTKDPEPA